MTWCSVWGLPIQSGVIRSFYVIVKNHTDSLRHLEGTKILFCDLQHTTLAADRGAKHTICLSGLLSIRRLEFLENYLN